MGWGQHIDLEWNSKLHRYETTRSLPPGRYPYKFIMDGRWTYSADHPTFTVSSPPMALLLSRSRHASTTQHWCVQTVLLMLLAVHEEYQQLTKESVL